MGQRVLIVDDAYFMRNLIKKVLKEAGYEIVGEAKNGTEGISLYFELKPDFVTMDINMPDMSGIEVTRHILSKDPKAKIVAVTGSDSDQVREDMMAAGAKGYLKKPFQPAFLLTKIEEMFSPIKEDVPPPDSTEVVVVEKQDELEEEDDFFGKEIQLLNEPDETRVNELKIENNEDRIEFPEDDDSLDSKEKYALVTDEPATPFVEEPYLGSEEEAEKETFDEEDREEQDSGEQSDSLPTHINYSPDVHSNDSHSMKGEEAVEQENEQLVQEAQREHQVIETPVPPSTDNELPETTAVEEPHSYLQIRPPRGKVLSNNPALHEQDHSSSQDIGELIIHANGEVEQASSQKKGFLSFFTNLFKIK